MASLLTANKFKVVSHFKEEFHRIPLMDMRYTSKCSELHGPLATIKNRYLEYDIPAWLNVCLAK